MHSRERETLATDQWTARKLIAIADDVSASRLLVEAAFMASESLPTEYGAPLCSLLNLVSERLKAIGEDLTQSSQEDVSDAA